MATSTGPAPTNEWFQPGDTIIFNQTENTTMTFGNGTSANVYIITSKKIPSEMALSGNITVHYAWKNGEQVENPSYNCAIRNSENSLYLLFIFPKNIGALAFVRLDFSGTITFG